MTGIMDEILTVLILVIVIGFAVFLGLLLGTGIYRVAKIIKDRI